MRYKVSSKYTTFTTFSFGVTLSTHLGLPPSTDMSWSLAPFLASVALYWAALIPDTQPSLLALGTTATCRIFAAAQLVRNATE